MFIGRQRELKTLERLYASVSFEFAVIYGRRRVGKTALINHFIKNKKAIYFTGIESNVKQNLENLSSSILEYAVGAAGKTTFLSFQAALEYVFTLAEKERIVFVIDEYPYAARSEKSLASTLQYLIDKNKATSKLLLILCGSSMSYMEDNVLAYKAPLYGRRSAQIKLQPFDFFEARKCFTGFSSEDMMTIYGVTGGTPQYLLKMNDKISVEENIRDNFLNPNSALYEEPLNLLKQEVREPSVYNAVITAIASDASRMSEIADKVGEDSSICTPYIKNLIALGILQKETPLGDKASKKSIYSIMDNMFRFWYRFIPENASVIARGADELAYRRIKPQLSDYMGKIFEEVCRQYLWKLLLQGQSPIEFTELGRWWGNDPTEKKQAEIDIMGIQDKDTALFGECKWKNEKTDAAVLDTLQHRSRLFACTNTHLFLFSKSGFTQSCMDKAEKSGNVTLLSYEDMLKGDDNT